MSTGLPVMTQPSIAISNVQRATPVVRMEGSPQTQETKTVENAESSVSVDTSNPIVSTSLFTIGIVGGILLTLSAMYVFKR